MANWKKIMGGVVAAVVTPGAIIVAYASTRPSDFHIERVQRIEASSATVYAQIEDMHAWAAWSPWEKLDPTMKRSFSGAPKGVGAIYEWEGNKDVGQGRMTITEAVPGARIVQKLEFIKPFEATNKTMFAIAPDGDKAVKLTWSMDGHNNLGMKVFGLFMNMDKQVGGDFEKGLASIKAIAEKSQAATPAAAK